ncbi:dihydroorotate dehydrogenase-like protein [Anaerolinea thermophila]|uniref:Dihydroorotate dehydrogenase family protein n=1 Tax=Anaerolinea thermophila (strain DSM 14523 / JCM 11388 / NBRC 100420 / UNI-1) TaxID=926569 RepID=E8N1B4_ANATU|nr:dihydroorotate dehydrogenase-like protein [Anaerolinea thermophila]BAJ64857.1 dihydroorotate dehydrogenase family protein [Anaerolinea thermophila UNI-1]
MANLTATYLGLTLKNPVVASASPLSKKLEGIRRLEEAGASAVVMYSLFEEQITHESLALDHFLNRGTESFAEALSYFPDLENYNIGPEEYLNLIRRAKEAVSIPIIGSLNGVSAGGWVEYARKIEEAGADALELNMYYIPTDTDITAQELEQNYVDLVSEVCSRVSIPVAVKLSPFFTALPNLARRLAGAGAKGLVLFNRFIQPDLDIETLEVTPALQLSTPAELRLPLRWVAILYGRVPCDLALTSGVHDAQAVLKAMMAGAKVTMLASELIQNGLKRIGEILTDMNAWMETFEYESVSQMQGSMSQKAVAEPAAFERANYLKALQTFDNRKLY